jgi:hypothetical protein
MQVGLGVLNKDENVGKDMVDIMTFLHQFVPVGENGEPWPNYVLSFGDLLTCERQQNSQEDQRDGPTVSKRLEGLIPCISDFHTFGNFLKVKSILNSYYSSINCRERGA